MIGVAGFDARTALAGNVVGRRSDHRLAGVMARRWLHNAAEARQREDRALAARCLRQAGRYRRRLYERTTPAPPPPDATGRWRWMPTLHTWIDWS